MNRYNPGTDFVRVRDLLVETYTGYDRTYNWRLDRWNYARYFVAPMIGDRGEIGRKGAIRLWENAVGLWDDPSGKLLAAANTEHPLNADSEYGDFFFQRRPDTDHLLDAMFEHIERVGANVGIPQVGVHIFETDRTLQAAAQSHGYSRNDQARETTSELSLATIPKPYLPPGFRIRSMEEKNDLSARVKVLGLGFNHQDPAEWASIETYRELQRAPDYGKSLDLVVVNPEGEYVSFCIVWVDKENRIGVFEPVGTHPAYRRMGLGRAVMLEGMHRMKKLNCEKALVGSSQPFYRAIGFSRIGISYAWTKMR